MGISAHAQLVLSSCSTGEVATVDYLKLCGANSAGLHFSERRTQLKLRCGPGVLGLGDWCAGGGFIVSAASVWKRSRVNFVRRLNQSLGLTENDMYIMLLTRSYTCITFMYFNLHIDHM